MKLRKNDPMINHTFETADVLILMMVTEVYHRYCSVSMYLLTRDIIEFENDTLETTCYGR